jgi:hypothetical protein
MTASIRAESTLRLMRMAMHAAKLVVLSMFLPTKVLTEMANKR